MDISASGSINVGSGSCQLEALTNRRRWAGVAGVLEFTKSLHVHAAWCALKSCSVSFM